MTAPSKDNDYIQAFMTERTPDFNRAALIVVDMQYATGHRDGALGRRLAAEGSNVAGYRFDRIETKVVPNMQRLLKRFRDGDGAVIYLTVGAAKVECSDAPPHMIKMFRALDNHAGSREHEIIDELKPRPGESVINKTTIGAFASTGIDHLLRSLGRDQLYMGGVSTNMCVDTTAREAAGAIHTDFAKGFIAAETVSCDDFVALGGEAGAREAGKMRAEGRDYVVRDGDIILFRFNV